MKISSYGKGLINGLIIMFDIMVIIRYPKQTFGDGVVIGILATLCSFLIITGLLGKE